MQLSLGDDLIIQYAAGAQAACDALTPVYTQTLGAAATSASLQTYNMACDTQAQTNAVAASLLDAIATAVNSASSDSVAALMTAGGDAMAIIQKSALTSLLTTLSSASSAGFTQSGPVFDATQTGSVYMPVLRVAPTITSAYVGCYADYIVSEEEAGKAGNESWTSLQWPDRDLPNAVVDLANSAGSCMQHAVGNYSPFFGLQGGQECW